MSPPITRLAHRRRRHALRHRPVPRHPGFWVNIKEAWQQVDGGVAVADFMEIKPPRSSATARVKELLPEFITVLAGLMAATPPSSCTLGAHFSMTVDDFIRAKRLSTLEHRNLGLDTDQKSHAHMALGTGFDDKTFLHARAFVVAVGAEFAGGSSRTESDTVSDGLATRDARTRAACTRNARRLLSRL